MLLSSRSSGLDRPVAGSERSFEPFSRGTSKLRCSPYSYARSVSRSDPYRMQSSCPRLPRGIPAIVGIDYSDVRRGRRRMQFLVIKIEPKRSRSRRCFLARSCERPYSWGMIGSVAIVRKKTERGLYGRQCETKVAEGHVSRACIRGVCRTAHGSNEVPEIVPVITCVCSLHGTVKCAW